MPDRRQRDPATLGTAEFGPAYADDEEESDRSAAAGAVASRQRSTRCTRIRSVAVLAEDVTLWADGGGKAPGAALNPVHGASSVARFVFGVIRRTVPSESILRSTRINGLPGFIVYVEGRPLAAHIFEIRDARIHNIYAIANPEKLQGLPL